MGKKKTYRDYLDKSVEHILQNTTKGKQRRLPALALYLQNFDLSVQDVAELLDIPEGTAIKWSTDDKWNEKRNEIKDNIKQSIITTAQTKHAEQLEKALSNLIFSLVSASEDGVPIMEAKDIKSLVDSIEKVYKIFGDLNIIQQQTQKVEMEHTGKVEHDHDMSKYEEHMNKFNDMLDKVIPQNEEEDNEE